MLRLQGLEIANQSMLIYFTFDRISGDSVYDDSGYQNDGELVKKAGLAKDAGKCGHGLRTQGGKLIILQ